jgi:hypothetical protein
MCARLKPDALGFETDVDSEMALSGEANMDAEVVAEAGGSTAGTDGVVSCGALGIPLSQRA